MSPSPADLPQGPAALVQGAASRSWSLVESVVGSALASVSAARGARVFHPVGVAHRAVLTVYPEPGREYGVPLLDLPAEHRAVVRLSRAAGVPQGLPDVLGLAIRLLDVHGEGAHQDLLLNTAGRLPLARQVFVPATGVLERSYSSVLPYSLAGVRHYIGAQPVREAGGLLPRFDAVERAAEAALLRFRIVVARPLGPWHHVATLRIDERLPDAEAEALSYDVFANTGGGIAPAGLLQTLRRTSYRMSQQVRPHPSSG